MKKLLISALLPIVALAQTGASQVSSKLPATGAKVTNVQAKLGIIPDLVNDFGADSTGVADATAAIQAALNYSATGNCVYAPGGTYKITSVTLTGNMCLESNGAGGNSDSTYAQTASFAPSTINTSVMIVHGEGNRLRGFRMRSTLATSASLIGIDMVATGATNAQTVARNFIEDVFVFGTDAAHLFNYGFRIKAAGGEADDNYLNRIHTNWSQEGLHIEANDGPNNAGINSIVQPFFAGGNGIGVSISHGAKGNNLTDIGCDGLTTCVSLTNGAVLNYGSMHTRGEAITTLFTADATSGDNMFSVAGGTTQYATIIKDATPLGKNKFWSPSVYSYGLGSDTSAFPLAGWLSVNCGDYIPTYCASSTLSVFSDPNKASMFSGRLSSNSAEIDWDFQPFGTGYIQLLGVTNAANIVARFGTKNYSSFHDPEIWYSDAGNTAMAKTKWGYSNHGITDATGYYSICPNNAAGTPTCTIRFDGKNPTIQFAGTPSTWASISAMLDPNSPYGIIGCAANTAGVLTPISNSNTGTFDATITGAGAFAGLAYCNGTNWKFR